MLPVVMGIEFALFEITENLARIAVSNDRTKADCRCVRTRNHDFEGVGSDSQHVVGFGSAI